MSEPGVSEQSGPNSAEPDAGQSKISPGAQLAAYREERGWTIEQVASQLNLAPRQIVAIEHDDYSALPGMPIVRGFIRTYAKLLKVDPAPLLAGMSSEVLLPHDTIVPKQSLSTPFSDARLPSMTERSGLSTKWVLGGLLTVLAGVAIWAAKYEGNIIVIPKPTLPQIEEGIAGITRSNENPLQVNPGTKEQSAMAPIASAELSQPPAAAPEVPPIAGVATAPTAQEASVAGDKDALQFKVSQESWIEVRRADNNAVVFSRIVKAGEDESIAITGPVSVVIGNAAGVAVILRGTPVEFKSNAKSNVARINLK